jgi:hypothetical protein
MADDDEHRVIAGAEVDEERGDFPRERGEDRGPVEVHVDDGRHGARERGEPGGLLLGEIERARVVDGPEDGVALLIGRPDADDRDIRFVRRLDDGCVFARRQGVHALQVDLEPARKRKHRRAAAVGQERDRGALGRVTGRTEVRAAHHGTRARGVDKRLVEQAEDEFLPQQAAGGDIHPLFADLAGADKVDEHIRDRLTAELVHARVEDPVHALSP